MKFKVFISSVRKESVCVTCATYATSKCPTGKQVGTTKNMPGWDFLSAFASTGGNHG